MKPFHWLLIVSLIFGRLHSVAQQSSFPDTNYLKQEYTRQQAIKAELERLQAMQLQYQRDKKNNSSVKSTLSSLPIHWEERGPTGLPNGINQVIIDANDPAGKKAWAATWGGLWYNNDITADSSWHLKKSNLRAFSVAQNPSNSREMFISTFDKLFRSIDAGNTWDIFSESGAFQIKFNHQGDLFSACLDDCSNSDFIYKLNRSSKQFEPILYLWSDLGLNQSVKIDDLEFDYENLIYFSLNNGKIFRSSTANGGVWENIMNLPLSNISYKTKIDIGKDENNNKIIYAINLKQYLNYDRNINWLRKSQDGGESWSELPIPELNSYQLSAIDNVEILLSPVNPSIVNIAASGFANSQDGGQNWNVPYIFDLYTKSFATNSAGTNYLVASQIKIKQLKNIFSSEQIIGEARIKNLNTNLFGHFGFRNDYNDSIFFSSEKKLIGKHLMKRGDLENWPFFYFDSNETDLVFSMGSKIIYYNRNWQISRIVNVDFGSNPQSRAYDEKYNVFYFIKAASKINDYSKLVRIKGIGENNESVDTLQIHKYFFAREMVATTDSTLILVNHNFDNNTFELYRLTIHSDNTVTYLLLNSSSTEIIKLLSSRENPNFITNLREGLFFSNDGGINWTNKTISIPNNIQDYALNQGNPDNVFVTTFDNIYVTYNFTNANVIWESIIGTLDNNIPYSLPYIWYKESEGQLWVSNFFRGAFSTNYFQNQLKDSIIIANYTKGVNINDSIKVSFYRNGPFSENNSYELWLSDAFGNFNNGIKIGHSSTSPIFGKIPIDIFSSKNYKIRVISTNNLVPIIHADIGPFELNHCTDIILGNPKVINPTDNGFVVNINVSQNAKVWYVVVPGGEKPPTLSQFVWGKDSTGITFLIADSSNIIANENNTIIFTGLLPGTTYDIYLASKIQNQTCFSSLHKVTATTRGISKNYCSPKSISGCVGNNYFSEISVYNSFENSWSFFSKYNSGCSQNSYFNNFKNAEKIIAGQLSKNVHWKIHDFLGYYPSKGIGAWIDYNSDGDFNDPSESLLNGLFDMNDIYSFNLFANNQTVPGIKRMRIRVIDGAEYTYPMSPCATYQYGETEDYLVKVETNEPYIFANLDKDTVGHCENIKVAMEITGSYNVGNTFRVELSNPTGSFTDSTVLLSGISVNLPVNIQIPRTIPTGHNYRLRVVSTNPVAVSYESAVFSIQPTTQQIITNFSADTHTFNQTGSISATNKNTNAARVNFKGWNSVILLPDFEAKPNNSGVFKAEIVGCNN
ncbi:MAG: GEVED domain-containing protein [Bacteroidetes bacterium]|nr:GEVED domain-containing protein [Bacteroidota bacterium]